MKSFLPFVIILFTISACDDGKKTESSTDDINSLNEAVIGTWNNVTLNVTIKTDAGDSMVNVAKGQWENVLGIKPIVTEINQDGTFTSNYYTLEDELMMTSSGTWKMNGDSLIMIQNGETTAYHLNISNNLGTFTGYLDWDQDGESDDLYIGTQKKTIE